MSEVQEKLATWLGLWDDEENIDIRPIPELPERLERMLHRVAAQAIAHKTGRISWHDFVNKVIFAALEVQDDE